MKLIELVQLSAAKILGVLVKAGGCEWDHVMEHKVNEDVPGPHQWHCDQCGRQWIFGHSDMSEREWMDLQAVSK